MKNHSSETWPETFKSVLIRDGNFKPFFRFFFVIVGVAVIFLDLNVWRTGWLKILGFVMGGIGGIPRGRIRWVSSRSTRLPIQTDG